MDNTTKGLCAGCGQCCLKGGPLLHIEDMPLVHGGHIFFSMLVTLRKGELAHNGVNNTLAPLKAEVIKIAGTQEQKYPWHCVLHDDSGCKLYPLRPAQCEALFCRDTSKLEAMYQLNLATREHLLAKAPAGWLELAHAHEEECSINVLADLLKDYKKSSADILQMVRYDRAFRELCVQKANMPAEALDCVLGRELEQFLRSLGFAVQGENLVMVSKSKFIL